MCHTALMDRHVRQNSQSVHPTHGPSNEGNRVGARDIRRSGPHTPLDSSKR